MGTLRTLVEAVAGVLLLCSSVIVAENPERAVLKLNCAVATVLVACDWLGGMWGKASLSLAANTIEEAERSLETPYLSAGVFNGKKLLLM